MAEPLDPTPLSDPEGAVALADRADLDAPWYTLVWNDPVNLMSYVTFVLMDHFGYPQRTAEAMMMDIHTKGRCVVSTGSREAMEVDTKAMQEYGLWATLGQDT
ncbi:ATP-dependent Clp protease adapter ClpS [Kytococcus sedentarius]|uniref:ATP-dependent Clp protease adapter ClpS n=1 Tax=Kytococcus sedentarius TaxID=1276 RepID=UPI0035BC52A2